MLKDRQKIILEATIREHIRTARPIASRELLEELGFSVSPATVRNEMLQLDEMGYLEQPYTSAGRIPTDRGYRFFVDNALDEKILDRRERHRIEELFETESIEAFARECGKTIARMTHCFTAVGVEDDLLADSGFSELFDEPEFQDIARIKAFGQLVDVLEDGLSSLMKKSDDEKIFIGKENSLKEAEPYTIMITHWSHPKGFNGFLALVGPTRMDYQKNISLIRYLNSLYESDE